MQQDVEEVKALSIAEYEERYAKDTLPASPDIASPEPLVGVEVRLHLCLDINCNSIYSPELFVIVLNSIERNLRLK